MMPQSRPVTGSSLPITTAWWPVPWTRRYLFCSPYNIPIKLILISRKINRSSFGIYVFSSRLWLSSYPKRFIVLMWTARSQWCLQLVAKSLAICLRPTRHRWWRLRFRMYPTRRIGASPFSRTWKERPMDSLLEVLEAKFWSTTSTHPSQTW